MAVGKGSMERAAKAAAPAKAAEKKPAAASVKAADKKQTVAPVKAAVKKTETAAPAKAETKKKTEVKDRDQIVYQKSSGMLEREAAPNELFGVGDEMPVYYF